MYCVNFFRGKKGGFVCEFDGGKAKNIQVKSAQIAFGNGLNKIISQSPAYVFKFVAPLCQQSRRVNG
jgi:hypothetical protein